MTTHNPESSQANESGAAPSSTRRRLLAGGGGVLLAVQAKTALGTAVCQSPSAMISGNTSPRQDGPPPCSGGRSPGFWRVPKHYNAWVGATHPTLKNVALCPTGLGGLSPKNLLDQGTPVLSVFPAAANIPLTSYTYQESGQTKTIAASAWGIGAVLAFPKDVGINEGHLLWHLCAAYLNALAFSDYALTPEQVVEAGQSLLTVGSWCPSSMNPSVCASNSFNPSSFVQYISGMYDINADLQIEQYCTTQ